MLVVMHERAKEFFERAIYRTEVARKVPNYSSKNFYKAMFVHVRGIETSGAGFQSPENVLCQGPANTVARTRLAPIQVGPTQKHAF